MGWSESISLTSRILTRSPTVNRQSIAVVGRAGGPVHELPVHVGGGGQPVDLHHVVFPLDAVARSVLVAPGGRGMRVLVLGRAGRRGVGPVVRRRGPCRARIVVHGRLAAGASGM